MSINEDSKKVFIIGYGKNIDHFIELGVYEDKNTAIKELYNMKSILIEFDILDYRIEVFIKNNTKYIYSGETIRL